MNRRRAASNKGFALPLIGALSFFVAAIVSGQADAAESPKSKIRDPHERAASIRLIAPIKTGARGWVRRTVESGAPVTLTNSYLFQLVKGVSQENQKRAEESIIAPLLRRTLAELVAAASDAQTKRLFGIPLVLLTDEAPEGLDEEVIQQARRLTEDPLFSPRGHYTESDRLKRYFRAMRFLAQASIDVSLDRSRFPYPRELLFPFETIHAVVDLFADPKRAGLVNAWRLVHEFYSNVNGPADMPTFSDMAEIMSERSLTKDAIIAWAEARGMPRINPEAGIAIQPLGERVGLHEVVIDEFKNKLMTDETPKAVMARYLRFSSLFAGFDGPQGRIRGIEERIAGLRLDTYYNLAVAAIAEGARARTDKAFIHNFHAAAFAALAEQTALMAKTSVMVRKSSMGSSTRGPTAELRLEPNARPYLAALTKALDRMNRLCEDLPPTPEGASDDDPEFIDIRPALAALTRIADGPGIVTPSESSWETVYPAVNKLPRDPAITVDVFHLVGRSGIRHYYQWAVAPFGARFNPASASGGPIGMELVFFEAWSDEIVPGSEGPLNNLQWRGRILDGRLGDLPTLVDLPSAPVDAE